MYGQEELSDHYILRYGFTQEFFEAFAALKYRKIELPLTIIRDFHIFIRPYVNKQIGNRPHVSALQQKLGLRTVKDAQRALARPPRLTRDLSNVKHRNMIVMPGILAPFAFEHFPRHPVMLIISNKNDRRALQGLTLPKTFMTYNYVARVRKAKPSSRKKKKLLQRASRLFTQHKDHPIFGKSAFQHWFVRRLEKAMKSTYALDRLIRKSPVGLVMDHVEIVNPGTTLALLGRKYNLPFLNVPQVLISDRSLIPTRATYHCAWGKNYKKWLEKKEIPSSAIKLTGNMGFEYSAPKQYQPKRCLFEQLNIPAQHYVIAYTTQPFSKKVNQQITQWIQRVPTHLPLTIIIKPHPYDKQDYTEPFTAQPNVRIASPHINLYELLYHSDYVMTISSNTAIEGAKLGSGIIVLQPQIPYDYEHHNNDFNSHLVRGKAGITVSNGKELANVCQRIDQDKRLRKILAKRSTLFLQNTLVTHHTPSVHVRCLITRLLNNKDRFTPAKQSPLG